MQPVSQLAHTQCGTWLPLVCANMASIDSNTSLAASGASSASSGICVRYTSHSDRSLRKRPAPPRQVTVCGDRSRPT